MKTRTSILVACLALVTAVAAGGCGSTGGGGGGGGGSGGSTGAGGSASGNGGSGGGGSSGTGGSSGGASGGLDAGASGSGGSGGAGSGGSGGATGAGGATGSGGATGAGGASDGGASDLRPSTDAGADRGASTDGASSDGATSAALCPPAALVCDDFEDGNLDGWTAMPAGGAMTNDTTRAAHGTRSLSINIPGNQRGGFLERRGAPLFPLPNRVMWGRLMVYFDSVPDGHTDIVRGAPAGGGTPWYNVGEQHGEILLNYYNGASRDCWARPRPGKIIPIRTWMCWEWSFNAASNQMQFFIDGALSRQVDGMGDGCLTGNFPWVAPEFAVLRIGEYIAELSNTATRTWIDDVAVGNTTRIGCPAP